MNSEDQHPDEKNKNDTYPDDEKEAED